MSIAQLSSPLAPATPRWLLLGSLALNLFFIGVAVALAVRGPAPAAPLDRSVAARIERLAATLPAADADKLRAQYQANRNTVEAASSGYRAAQELVRQTLRREPFDIEVMRAAMAQTRAARQGFDQVLHAIIAAATAEMSPAGRNKLADWPPGPRPDNNR